MRMEPPPEPEPPPRNESPPWHMPPLPTPQMPTAPAMHFNEGSFHVDPPKRGDISGGGFGMSGGGLDVGGGLHIGSRMGTNTGGDYEKPKPKADMTVMVPWDIDQEIRLRVEKKQPEPESPFGEGLFEDGNVFSHLGTGGGVGVAGDFNEEYSMQGRHTQQDFDKVPFQEDGPFVGKFHPSSDGHMDHSHEYTRNSGMGAMSLGYSLGTCHQCGNIYMEDSVFCRKCGAKSTQIHQPYDY